MNAIVTAGGEIQSDQPLYSVTQGGRKAMLEIAGKPMVQWVLDALSGCASIERVFLVGLPPETSLDCAHELVLLPDEGDMLANIRSASRAVLSIEPEATHAVLASGDVPGLRPEMIEWLLCQVDPLDQDIYYTIIERATMELSFPESKRTYVHLKSIQVCGGDLHCFRLKIAVEESSLWKRLIDARKSPVRQAGLLGYDTLLFLMLRQLSLRDAEKAVCSRLGIQGRALVSPYAEVGMDVDKPFQLEIMREHLSRRHEKYHPGVQPAR